jgi:predicted DNA-binding ribbon-helix-helix protein
MTPGFCVKGEASISTTMVYIGAMMALAKRARAKSLRTKYVRRSVTLPPKIAKQVETLARERDLSDNRVLVELIEQGIEARQQKEKAFFQLAERFRAANDPEQVKQLGNQLGRFVFGE